MPVSEPEPLDEFVRDGASRIARLTGESITDRVSPAFRSAAASVARQAEGNWTVKVVPGDAFATDVAMRTLRIGDGFAVQCSRVVDTIISSANPELIQIVATLGDIAQRAIMSAFFHYFTAHEFIHVEQGLGSDQYRDSDFYMPIVMEADYDADVAGLVIAMEAAIPELAALTAFQTTVLLMAIHVAAMHGFAPSRRTDARPRRRLTRHFGEPKGLDAHTFQRLLIWYMHFARVTKAGVCPVFASPEFMRSWIVMLPRLVAADRVVTIESVAERRRRPYQAGSDLVLAYHGEDGLYRIHRAAFTDVDRTHRLCVAILQEEFDAVRAELEELLVFNPALVPTDQPRNVDVEWVTSGLIETLDLARTSVARGDIASVSAEIPTITRDFGQLTMLLRTEAARNQGLQTLLHQVELTFAEFERELAGDAPDTARLGSQLLRILSVVDQLAVSLN